MVSVSLSPAECGSDPEVTTSPTPHPTPEVKSYDFFIFLFLIRACCYKQWQVSSQIFFIYNLTENIEHKKALMIFMKTYSLTVIFLYCLT
jgi:hypothetical protein